MTTEALVLPMEVSMWEVDILKLVLCGLRIEIGVEDLRSS